MRKIGEAKGLKCKTQFSLGPVPIQSRLTIIANTVTTDTEKDTEQSLAMPAVLSITAAVLRSSQRWMRNRNLKTHLATVSSSNLSE